MMNLILSLLLSPVILWSSEGVKTGNIPANTVMALTPLTMSGVSTDWATIYSCKGAPVSENGTLTGGFGVYVLERYTSVSSPGEFLSLIVHAPFAQGGSQSIPPISFPPGPGGIRIKTLVPLKGILSCEIEIYTVP